LLSATKVFSLLQDALNIKYNFHAVLAFAQNVDLKIVSGTTMQLLSLGLAAVAASSGASAATQLPLPLSSTMAPAAADNSSCCHASAHIQEILSLSELPMDRLLRVKLAMHPYTREANLADRKG